MIALLLAAALLASGPQAPATSTPAVPEISLGAPLDKAAIRNQRDAAKLYPKASISSSRNSPKQPSKPSTKPPTWTPPTPPTSAPQSSPAKAPSLT